VNHVFGVHRTFPIQKKDTSQHAQLQWHSIRIYTYSR
jgi:hypothetical protein